MEYIGYTEHLVFGLDIGTRSIVGTVGYRENQNHFIVIAQCVKEHETRAMLDGQIHDIEKVAETIAQVKKQLESQIGKKLTDVCIAAAGRVLKTVTVKADYEFPSETVVTKEHIHSLDLIGVEKAYETLREELKEDKISFYCVGYSVIRYYLNGFAISKLDGHKANTIATELLATFLPDEVIDGLYAAVEKAGLQVANLTLEPIAAINVAIPEKFRLLNIALVDVGAGTSDISITKDGSIIAYGMIPFAGDEITEAIVQRYLVEFNEAEKIKLACQKKKAITYKDIMGNKQKAEPQDVITSVSAAVQKITKSVADKIIELNGDKSVSAVFVVGGGGKIPGFVNQLADYLELSYDRVALRGEEVLGEVEFLQKGIKKDPLLVTPIGICLNFYDQKNNFIFVNVNGERVKLYDNNKLTIVDAAILIGFPYERLFPRRGNEINFTINGMKRMIRGEQGEAAVVKLNGEIVGLSHAIEQNDKIEIIESTIGKDAEYEIKQLSEYHSIIRFIFNEKQVLCPKFVMVNGELVSGFYNIQNNDEIHILDYYTVEQVLQFMDIKSAGTILVNNVPAGPDEKIYDNFTIQCDILPEYAETSTIEDETDITYENVEYKRQSKETKKPISQETKAEESLPKDIRVIINNTPVVLRNKPSYIFVDVFDFYPFDLSTIRGSEVVITLNGQRADFTTPLQENDVIELYWKA
ncbi:MAG: cell division protein FtsA [Anaerocolumna sp.]|nr:cell division protein FtsA [Anaerocolumna sp.]